ncbi:MAG: helix-turn-helix domain-containing protein [Thermoproteota archaeon]|nr:helix-turn-helix domain-containing protein [Thermoproteota archaeon]
MSIDTAPLILDFVILPFGVSLVVSLLALLLYSKIREKNGKRYLVESKIHLLEKQIREHNNRSLILAQKLDNLYAILSDTNEKLDNIQEFVKLLDKRTVNNIVDTASQHHVASPQQPHVSNADNIKSQSHHNEISQIQSGYINHEERQSSTVDYILKKLEDNPLSTREIQQIIGRSREHTSRLMKKLYDEKLVNRDMRSKPFRYTITNEGHRLLIKHSASKSSHQIGSYQKQSQNLEDGLIGS